MNLILSGLKKHPGKITAAAILLCTLCKDKITQYLPGPNNTPTVDVGARLPKKISSRPEIQPVTGTLPVTAITVTEPINKLTGLQEANADKLGQIKQLKQEYASISNLTDGTFVFTNQHMLELKKAMNQLSEDGIRTIVNTFRKGNYDISTYSGAEKVLMEGFLHILGNLRVAVEGDIGYSDYMEAGLEQGNTEVIPGNPPIELNGPLPGANLLVEYYKTTMDILEKSPTPGTMNLLLNFAHDVERICALTGSRESHLPESREQAEGLMRRYGWKKPDTDSQQQ